MILKPRNRSQCHAFQPAILQICRSSAALCDTIHPTSKADGILKFHHSVSLRVCSRASMRAIFTYQWTDRVVMRWRLRFEKIPIFKNRLPLIPSILGRAFVSCLFFSSVTVFALSRFLSTANRATDVNFSKYATRIHTYENNVIKTTFLKSGFLHTKMKKKIERTNERV